MLTSDFKDFAIKLPRRSKQALAFVFDLLICIATTWLAFLLRIDQAGLFVGNQWFVLIAAISLSIPLFVISGFYRAIFRYVGGAALSSLLRAYFIYALVFCLIFTVIGFEGIPRSIGIIQPILLFFSVGLSRYSVRAWLSLPSSTSGVRSSASPKILIYGAGKTGRQIANSILMQNEGLVYGFIDDKSEIQGQTINGLRIYRPEDFPRLVNRFGITDLLIAIPSISRSRKNGLIESFGGQTVRIRAIPATGLFRLNQLHLVNLQDLDMSDLLGREVVSPNEDLLKKNIFNKKVLVTGAGGSIGSELCRQILSFAPEQLILVDSSEYALYSIYEELKLFAQGFVPPFDRNLLEPILGSLMSSEFVDRVFAKFSPDTVFHAAAYKHVPLVERNISQGILNNVLSTENCVKACIKNDVSNFILISTDKAVRPTNIMGASKRISELILQAYADYYRNSTIAPKFSMVRFGNVLGSSGSVAPLFIRQIESGGPLTLTHLDVTRFFMTIPEAAQLVIQASSMSEGGDVFILDMGESVRIYDLALRLIQLAGLVVKDDENAQGDIEIKVTGLRPGEKLYEELLLGNNPSPTAHSKIQKANEEFISLELLNVKLNRLYRSLSEANSSSIISVVQELVPDYSFAELEE